MKIKGIAPWFESRVHVMRYVLWLVKTGILSIDDEGRVWRHFVKTRYSRVAIPVRRAESKTQKGYLAITVGIPGTRVTKCVMAHRLVWTYLNGEIEGDLQINHMDLNKKNNNPSNLELVTGAENIRHSYRNGRNRPWYKSDGWPKSKEWRPGKPLISDATKAFVCDLKRQGFSISAISMQSGISKTHVARILRKAVTI